MTPDAGRLTIGRAGQQPSEKVRIGSASGRVSGYFFVCVTRASHWGSRELSEPGGPARKREGLSMVRTDLVVVAASSFAAHLRAVGRAGHGATSPPHRARESAVSARPDTAPAKMGPPVIARHRS